MTCFDTELVEILNHLCIIYTEAQKIGNEFKIILHRYLYELVRANYVLKCLSVVSMRLAISTYKKYAHIQQILGDL